MAIKLKAAHGEICGDEIIYHSSSQCPVGRRCNTRIFLDFCDCVKLEAFCKQVYVIVPVCGGTEHIPEKLKVPLVHRGKKLLGYQLARYVNTSLLRRYPVAVLDCVYNGDLREIFVLNNDIECAIPICCDERHSYIAGYPTGENFSMND